MDMLRERIKGLEHKIIEMIRAGQENVAIADRLHRWTRSLMLTSELRELPEVLVAQLRQQFLVPQAQCGFGGWMRPTPAWRRPRVSRRKPGRWLNP